MSVEAALFRSRDLDSEAVSPDLREVVEPACGRHLPERGICDILAVCLGAVEGRCPHAVAAVRQWHFRQQAFCLFLTPPALGLGSKDELATLR